MPKVGPRDRENGHLKGNQLEVSGEILVKLLMVVRLGDRSIRLDGGQIAKKYRSDQLGNLKC